MIYIYIYIYNANVNFLAVYNIRKQLSRIIVPSPNMIVFRLTHLMNIHHHRLYIHIIYIGRRP